MTAQFSLPSRFFKTQRQIKKMYHNSLKNLIFYQKKKFFILTHTFLLTDSSSQNLRKKPMLVWKKKF